MRADSNAKPQRSSRPGHLVLGDIQSDGWSLEWHEFSEDCDGGWRWEFPTGQLVLCLNFGGSAKLQTSVAAQPKDQPPPTRTQAQNGRSNLAPTPAKSSLLTTLEPEQILVLATGTEPLQLIRPNGPIHRFYLVTLTPSFLTTALHGALSEIHPGLQALACANPKRPATREPSTFHVTPFPTPLLNLRSQLLDPPVPSTARHTWTLGKIHELLAHSLFPAKPELFCERHHRINRERCARVLYLLERDMENPPSLEMLAAETDCSPFTLSRIFTQETGQSIPKALRKLRIERAAQLLQAGNISVTDAAMTVGYASLGAFNKAFSNLMGCPPSQFTKSQPPIPPHHSIPKKLSS